MTQNFQDNSLTISGTIARDSGTYTCVVSNGLDNATAGAILTVKGNRKFNVSPNMINAKYITFTVIGIPTCCYTIL